MPLLLWMPPALAAALLAVSTGFSAADLFSQGNGAGRRRVASFLAGSAAGLLFVFLGMRGFPTATGMDVLSWAALGAAGVHLAFLRVRALGVFLLPVAAACAAAAPLAGERPWGAAGSAQVPWMMFHGIAALLGQAAFALAFASGALYLVQHRRLKADPTRSGLLPSLEVLDRLNLLGLIAALSCWTASLLAAFLHTVTWSPLVLFSGAVWALLAGVTGVRLAAALRGPKVAALSVTAFLMSLLLLLVGHP